MPPPLCALTSGRRFAQLLLNLLGVVEMLLDDRSRLLDQLLELLVLRRVMRLSRQVEHRLVNSDLLLDVGPVEGRALGRTLERGHLRLRRGLERVFGRKLRGDTEPLGQLLPLRP